MDTLPDLKSIYQYNTENGKSTNVQEDEFKWNAGLKL